MEFEGGPAQSREAQIMFPLSQWHDMQGSTFAGAHLGEASEKRMVFCYQNCSDLLFVGS